MKKLLFSLSVLLLLNNAAYADSNSGTEYITPYTRMGEISAKNQTTFNAEAKWTEINQKGLDIIQPPPQIKWSVERNNLIRRLRLLNNSNKLGYIYLYTPGGTCLGYYVVKGKVSSCNSLLTAPQQLIKDPYSFTNYNASDRHGLIVNSPDFDGSYGDNEQGVFFFLVDGTYVTWNGLFIYTDRPINVVAKPLNVRFAPSNHKGVHSVHSAHGRRK